MNAPSPAVRPAELRDLPRLGALAGQLVRQHHHVDPARFLLVEGVEQGYERWFARELENPSAVLLAAERGGEVVGYGYATVEPRDWNQLLEEHGAIHDVLVAEEARGSGVGRLLVEGLVAALAERGRTRVVLHTMVSNEAAQRLFGACGFRKTMIEMTRG